MKEEITDVVIDDAAEAVFQAVGGRYLRLEVESKRRAFRDAAEAAIHVYIKSKTSG